MMSRSALNKKIKGEPQNHFFPEKKMHQSLFENDLSQNQIY